MKKEGENNIIQSELLIKITAIVKSSSAYKQGKSLLKMFR